jgi:hypothetical protein
MSTKWRLVGVAPRHLALDQPLHDHVLLDSPSQLVSLRRVQMDELLELEGELAAEHPRMVEVASQQHLVHPTEVLLVEQVLVAKQLLIRLDLGRLQLYRGDDAVVWHDPGSLPTVRRCRGVAGILGSARPRSSVDQSGCLLSSGSQVRILPGTP